MLTIIKRIAALFGGALLTANAFANPIGGNVVAGSVSFSQNAGALTIQSSQQSSIINWSEFSIAPSESLIFSHPSPSASVLNRVTGGAPTFISGNISTNGNLYLINPAGFFFASGSRIEAQSIVLSTLNMNDADFLTGNLSFENNPASGPILFSDFVTLQVGGTISLFSGGTITLGSAPLLGGNLVIQNGGIGNLNLSPVPEPWTVGMLLAGLGLLGLIAQFRKHGA
ncbi:MAG: filamentous hemagglutinin [Gallionellaceae bacterium]|nr:MAG: filamentous hemagglutinin [Gallionellaceae bacterium]